MFGIKIITKKKYDEMCKICLELADATDELNIKSDKYVKKLKHDCESLREQNNDLRLKLNKFEGECTSLSNKLIKIQAKNNNYLREVKSLREFKRDTLEAMGQIDLAGFRLSYCTKKCKHCENEQQDCRKYQFGNHQYCVIPK